MWYTPWSGVRYGTYTPVRTMPCGQRARSSHESVAPVTLVINPRVSGFFGCFTLHWDTLDPSGDRISTEHNSRAPCLPSSEGKCEFRCTQSTQRQRKGRAVFTPPPSPSPNFPRLNTTKLRKAHQNFLLQSCMDFDHVLLLSSTTLYPQYEHETCVSLCFKTTLTNRNLNGLPFMSSAIKPHQLKWRTPKHPKTNQRHFHWHKITYISSKAR